MTSIFDIENIAFRLLAYPVSYVELVGTVFGLISVYLASKANILTWATGIVNELFLFILFFQTQLYADMFLQLYFFVVTILGWYNWNRKTVENRIFTSSLRTKIILVAILAAGTVVAGFFFRNIHHYFPQYFHLPASYPFVDSFIMVLSIIATVLLAGKKIESWYFWLTADVVSAILYFKKEIYFLSLEYLIFLLIAGYGLLNWKKQLKHG
jgi:nicotinamide mononucleotide transporter